MDQIQSDISLYGLVGYPVKHSLSPLMHNAAFKALDVNARYDLFSLEEKEISSFFENLKKEDSPVFGLNVTIPYKEKVIPFLDAVGAFAQKVGAINTVMVQKGRKLVGENTDGPGFLAHLSELGVDLADKHVTILGAGGAARAVIAVLCLISERPASVRLYDIDKIKADNLMDDLAARLNTDIVRTVENIEALDIETADILINATPVGMKEEDPLLIDPGVIHSGLFVYDLIYNPAQTELLRIARENGAKGSNGLGMLFYQGVLAFQHWAETELDDKIKNIMREALEKGLYGDQ